ncbi:MAG: hypothetical protein KDA91_25000 [Planctomycetaceae bacterium]|nr:hypothetical protein [Planctomycetaceae bacterium]
MAKCDHPVDNPFHVSASNPELDSKDTFRRSRRATIAGLYLLSGAVLLNGVVHFVWTISGMAWGEFLVKGRPVITGMSPDHPVMLFACFVPIICRALTVAGRFLCLPSPHQFRASLVVVACGAFDLIASWVSVRELHVGHGQTPLVLIKVISIFASSIIFLWVLPGMSNEDERPRIRSALLTLCGGVALLTVTAILLRAWYGDKDQPFAVMAMLQLLAFMIVVLYSRTLIVAASMIHAKEPTPHERSS